MKNNLHKILVFLSIILLVFSCFVFYFLNARISENKNNFEKNEIKWQQENDRVEGIKLLNNSIKKIESEKDLLDEHFAYSSNIVPFLDLIESFSNKVGAKTEVTQVDIPKDTSSLVVEMRTLGGFEQIYKFLLLLENSPYELETMSVDVQRENISDVIGKKNTVLKWEAVSKIRLLSFIK